MVARFLHEFWVFGLKQARACIFAGSFFVLLFLSNHIPLFELPRYDFLFIAAILIQIVLVRTGLETKDEVKTIAVFHLIGLALEIFKTHPAIGSWSYPEDGFFKIATVPLYSGFMYAAVGSYIAQSWRIMKLRMVSYPSNYLTVPLMSAVYLNFFTHHFIGDHRWILIALIVLVFARTDVYFTVTDKERRMPLLVAFVLIAFFIWIAENISTYLGAWQYPDQIHEWSLVSIGKINSWALLVIISILLIADLKLVKKRRQQTR